MLPPPKLETEKFRGITRNRIGDGRHIKGAHAGGHERLMGIPESGVGDKQPLLLERPIRKPFGPEFQKELASSGSRNLLAIVLRPWSTRKGLLGPVPLCVGIAVDDHIPKE